MKSLHLCLRVAFPRKVAPVLLAQESHREMLQLPQLLSTARKAAGVDIKDGLSLGANTERAALDRQLRTALPWPGQ